MNLKQMREARAALAPAMRAILDTAAADGNRALTDAEAADYDAKKAEFDKLTAQINRLEGQEGMEAVLETARPAAAAHAGPVHAPGPEAKTQFESLAEFLSCVARNPNDQRLSSLYNEEVGAGDRRGEQRMDTGSAGGFAVPTQFRGELLQVNPQGAIMRPGATVIPAGDPPDSAISMPALDQTGAAADAGMYGGVQVKWIAEGATKPETDFKLRNIKLEPQEVAATLEITDKLLRNWQAAGSVISKLFRGAVIAAEDYAFLRGDGVGKPLGVIPSGAAYLVNRDTASHVGYGDIKDMIARIRPNGGQVVWIASRSIMPDLLNMQDNSGFATGQGQYIWQANARDPAGNQLLQGYPILWNERSPGLGTKGDLALVDRSAYLIKDGSGPFVASSAHQKFDENKTVFKVFWNVDGQPWLTAPIKGEDDYQTSPFVVLN